MVNTYCRAVVEEYLPFVLASHTKGVKDPSGLERHVVVASVVFPINTTQQPRTRHATNVQVRKSLWRIMSKIIQHIFPEGMPRDRSKNKICSLIDWIPVGPVKLIAQYQLCTSVVVRADKLIVEITIHSTNIMHKDISHHVGSHDVPAEPCENWVKVWVMFLHVGIDRLIVPKPILPIEMPSLDRGNGMLSPQGQRVSLPRLMSYYKITCTVA